MARNDVGYKRPPTEHQFQKGKSGNPSGRPRAKESFINAAVRVMAEPVKAKTGDRVERMSTMRAIYRRNCHLALKGDASALKRVFDIIFMIEDQGQEAQVNDRAAFEDAARRAAKVFGMPYEAALEAMSPSSSRKAQRPADPALKSREAKRRELVARDKKLGVVRT